MGERVVRKVTPAVKNYEREREGREIGRASTAVRESNAVVGKKSSDHQKMAKFDTPNADKRLCQISSNSRYLTEMMIKYHKPNLGRNGPW